MPKIAALFSGQIREVPPSLFNKSLLLFFKSLDVDFYLTYWDEIGTSMAHSNNSIQKNNFFDIDNYLSNAFAELKITSKRSFNFDKWESDLDKTYSEIHFDNTENSYLTKNSLPQLYLIEECYNLIEKDNNYDFFFRLRFDNLFTLKFDESEFQKGIYNLNFGNAFYPNRIYDIFFMVSREYSSSVMKTYSRIPIIYNSYPNSKLEKRDTCNLLFKSVISDVSISKIKTFNFRYTDVFRPYFGINNYISYIFYSHTFNGNFINRFKILKQIASNFKEAKTLNIILSLIYLRINLFINLYIKRKY